ncbi:unnamed protein product [Oikopleura dioica]|uniref:Uncharacterized protein n=1 Tax=Oikopleura dioica TaxID=34765 RepID=E4X129_OIKDI|nr:unnamed protein product [Oikopleura dioica]
MHVAEETSSDYFFQKIILTKFKIALLFSASCFYVRPYLSNFINSKHGGICGFLYRSAKFSERSSLLMCMAFFASGIFTLYINLGSFYTCIFILFAVFCSTCLSL